MMCTHMLHTGYPEELKFKLLERRAKARQSLGKLEEGITDIETAIAALDQANLAEEKREGKKAELQRFGMSPWLDSALWEDHIRRLRKELSTALEGGGCQRAASPKPVEPLLPGENPKFPTFSDAVRIRWNFFFFQSVLCSSQVPQPTCY